MSKLIGRKPVEVNIASPKQDHIPYFNESTRLWETRNVNGFITGSNTFIGDQTISGSLFVSGNVIAPNLANVVSYIFIRFSLCVDWKYYSNNLGQYCK
jgi:hypothetical protein